MINIIKSSIVIFYYYFSSNNKDSRMVININGMNYRESIIEPNIKRLFPIYLIEGDYNYDLICKNKCSDIIDKNIKINKINILEEGDYLYHSHIDNYKYENISYFSPYNHILNIYSYHTNGLYIELYIDNQKIYYNDDYIIKLDMNPGIHIFHSIIEKDKKKYCSECGNGYLSSMQIIIWKNNNSSNYQSLPYLEIMLKDQVIIQNYEYSMDLFFPLS